MPGRGKVKPEEKVKIVIQYIAGEVSAKAGVDRKTLQRWVMQYKA